MTTMARPAVSVRTVDHWIGGAPRSESSGAYLDITSPVDHTPVARVARGDASDVDAAVRAAAAAQPSWRAKKPIERGRILLAIAAAVREHADELIDLEVSETGKPRRNTVPEIASVASYFEFYGTLVNLPTGDVIDLGPDQHVYTRREPFGVVGVITPWNVPLPQTARAVAPAIAAGNTVVTKPSEFTPSTATRLAQIAQEAGLPDGVLNVVHGLGPECGEALVTHPSVRKLAFTGSVAAGRRIGGLAADRVLPLTLELGGKSANIVFADADLELAAKGSAAAFTVNCGQVCSAGTRLLVQRSIHDEFVAKLVAEVEALDLREQVGPLITDAQFARVTRYFEIADDDGLHLATGGAVPDDPELRRGNYVRPTVYTGVDSDARLAREEVFGPVLVVIGFDDDDEAVSIANGSEYGLIAGVWTRDINRAFRVAESLDVGQVFVNSWSTGAVEVPFGGYKLSGYGKEKGIESLLQYQQMKAITVVYSPRETSGPSRP